MKKTLLVIVGMVLVTPFFVSAEVLTNQDTQVQSSCVTLTKTMSLGSTDRRTNGEVSELQNFLIDGGYFVGIGNPLIGVFDSKTVVATKKFQSATGVATASTSGYGGVGSKSRAKIKAMTCRGVNATNSSVSTASIPTATLTVNGSTNLTANVGDVVDFVWSSANGTSWVVDVNSSGCITASENGSESNVKTASGHEPETLRGANAGCNYTLKYNVSGPGGIATATAYLHVREGETQIADVVDMGCLPGNKFSQTTGQPCGAATTEVVLSNNQSNLAPDIKFDTSKTDIRTGKTGDVIKITWSSVNAESCNLVTRDSWGKILEEVNRGTSGQETGSIVSLGGSTNFGKNPSFTFVCKNKYGESKKTITLNVIDAASPIVANTAISNNSVNSTIPSITIVSPNGGETYRNDGSPIEVFWKTNNVSSAQSLNLIRLRSYADGREYDLVQNTPNDGKELVYISPSIPVGSYTLEIKTYVGGVLVTDSSDSYFKIAQ